MRLFKRPATMSFIERLLNIGVFWGLPMICLELIGIPYRAWASVLVLLVPATLVGIVIYAALEHWLFAK